MRQQNHTPTRALQALSEEARCRGRGRLLLQFSPKFIGFFSNFSHLERLNLTREELPEVEPGSPGKLPLLALYEPWEPLPDQDLGWLSNLQFLFLESTDDPELLLPDGLLSILEVCLHAGRAQDWMWGRRRQSEALQPSKAESSCCIASYRWKGVRARSSRLGLSTSSCSQRTLRTYGEPPQNAVRGCRGPQEQDYIPPPG